MKKPVGAPLLASAAPRPTFLRRPAEHAEDVFGRVNGVLGQVERQGCPHDPLPPRPAVPLESAPQPPETRPVDLLAAVVSLESGLLRDRRRLRICGRLRVRWSPVASCIGTGRHQVSKKRRRRSSPAPTQSQAMSAAV